MNRPALITAFVMLAVTVGAGGQSAGVRVAQVDGKTQYTNRLIDEKSPYLQLHAHNPVDWYPWGEEAFEKARREGKPIFLSIGYSTCHWCHVMEAESFSDPAIADLMNKNFVSIKVDREERPDVDRLYMDYLLASTGGGAWPVSAFLTPDLKPFFAGTYVPPDSPGKPGFRTLLQNLSASWAGDRARLLQAANQGTRLIESQAGAGGGPRSVNARVLDQTFNDLKASYDEANGGFGQAQKFPRPAVLNFLLRHYARTGTKPSLDMVLGTLGAMANSGIHDQLGGGFHRYATDRGWRVPHFEKMLYDQAQVAISYTEAYQITRDTAFAGIARDTLDYVLRDMRGPEGGFFSAEDADSVIDAGKPGQEGAFYVWTAKEIRDVVGADTADMFAFHYGVTDAGNVPPAQDLRGELKGRNVLSVRHTVAETAMQFHKSEDETRAALGAARQRLRDARANRQRPPRDDKVLVAWNGMMVSAFARASQVFDAPDYLDAARASAEFIQTRMYDANTNLLKRRYRLGQADIDGMLEDYVFLVQGLLDLYEASFDVKWLSWAMRLQEQQDRLFRDAKGGGYFSTRPDATSQVGPEGQSGRQPRNVSSTPQA
ncbi:MAG: thioredoxin domain-containing protein [Hyphomicrobiales bacterium]